MLENDLTKIGRRMYEARKKSGMTQAQAAEKAEISDRTYADIERGSVNMRIETLIAICEALKITPNELLLKEDEYISENELVRLIAECSEKEKNTMLKLIQVYIQSL